MILFVFTCLYEIGLSSLCVDASRIENHCERLVELKRLVIQLDDYGFETLKYLCAHFRRVTAKCDINKVNYFLQIFSFNSIKLK